MKLVIDRHLQLLVSCTAPFRFIEIRNTGGTYKYPFLNNENDDNTERLHNSFKNITMM